MTDTIIQSDPNTLEPRELDARVAEVVFAQNLRAVSDEDIACAVMSGMSASYGDGTFSHTWNGNYYGPLSMSDGLFKASSGFGGVLGNDAYGFYQWHKREGQPWQADIEAHVAAWRRKVPHYSTTWDGFGEVFDRLHELGFNLNVVTNLEGNAAFSMVKLRDREPGCYPQYYDFDGYKGPVQEAFGMPLPRAACIAAIRAIEGSVQYGT